MKISWDIDRTVEFRDSPLATTTEGAPTYFRANLGDTGAEIDVERRGEAWFSRVRSEWVEIGRSDPDRIAEEIQGAERPILSGLLKMALRETHALLDRLKAAREA